MGTFRQAIDGLKGQVVLALATPPTGVVIDQILTGWPLPQVLDSSLRTANPDGLKHAVVSVFPAFPVRVSRDGYLDGWVKSTLAAPTTTMIASASVIAAPGTMTVTIGGAPKTTDAISLVAVPGNLQRTSYGAVYVLTSTDTVATAAAGLATAINTTAPLNTWISAASSGAVITLTNLLTAPVGISVRAGGQGQFAREVDRRTARVQVHVFAPDPATRDSVGDLIDVALATLPFTAPLEISLPDNTQALVMPMSDEWRDETQQNDFRRVLTYDLIWPTLATLAGYDMLVGSVVITPLVLIDPHP